MITFPELITERLLLRKNTHLDIPQIVAYAGDERVAATTLNIPHPYATDDAIYWINSANQGFADGTQYTFGIRLQTTDEFIGGIGLRINKRFNRAELGYWIAVPFWNKGFATEAAGALLKYGFETLALNKILATHLVENPASGKVMSKNGMIKEGELKEHTMKDDQYRSLVQYRLTRKEYSTLAK